MGKHRLQVRNRKGKGINSKYEFGTGSRIKSNIICEPVKMAFYGIAAFFHLICINLKEV